MRQWALPAILLAAVGLVVWLAWPATADAQPAEPERAVLEAGAPPQAAIAGTDRGTAAQPAPAREQVGSASLVPSLRELPVRVLHAGGAPAAAARVELYAPIDPDVPAGPLPAPAQSSLSDTEGRCKFEVEPGLWRLRATFGAAACSEVLRVDWPKVRVYGCMPLELRPMALLRGIVLDEHRRAVAGAEVHVRPGCAGRDEDDQVFTDHVGSFALPVLAGRALTAQARWSGGVTMVESLELEAGSDRHVELAQLGARSVRGTVRDERGAPATGLRVTARREVESISSTETDGAGRFRVELAQPGDYMVEVGRGGLVLLTHPVRLAAEGEPPPLELQLGAAQRLRGRVMLPDGSACSGCTVQARSKSSGNERRVVEMQASTGKDGRFEFAAITPGAYDLAVWGEQSRGSVPPIQSRIVPAVTGDREVEIVVSPLSTDEPQVEITATDPEGKPLHIDSVIPSQIDAAGEIRFWPVEAFVRKFEAERACLFGLPEGETFVFSVRANGRARHQTKPITIQGRQRIHVELPLPGSIRLVVRRPPDIASEDIRVFAGKALGSNSFVGEGKPELVDGAWIWRADPGHYSVSAHLPPGPGGVSTGRSQSVIVEPGRTADVEIDLRMVSDSFPPFSGRTPDPRPAAGK